MHSIIISQIGRSEGDTFLSFKTNKKGIVFMPRDVYTQNNIGSVM